MELKELAPQAPQVDGHICLTIGESHFDFCIMQTIWFLSLHPDEPPSPIMPLIIPPMPPHNPQVCLHMSLTPISLHLFFIFMQIIALLSAQTFCFGVFTAETGLTEVTVHNLHVFLHI
jgi:hypothetical protein